MSKEETAVENTARGKEGTGKRERESVEPWYQVGREAAQIVVSALALYASIKSFVEKIKRRRAIMREEEV